MRTIEHISSTSTNRSANLNLHNGRPKQVYTETEGQEDTSDRWIEWFVTSYFNLIPSESNISLGIGYAVAEALLENGSTVIVSSSNPSRVEKTVSQLQKSYPSASKRISGHACNLGKEETLESEIVKLLDNVGQCDHIIHTAGDALAQMPIAKAEFSAIKQAGMVRFFSVLLLGKHAPKYLKGGRESSLIFTTGGVSERPIPDWTVVNGYATGLHGICRGLALDLKPIRVNLVSPGAVNTELWANSGFTEDQTKGMFESFESKLPTGKVPGPEDIAEAYLYLLKDNNVTGTVISSNSGHFLV